MNAVDALIREEIERLQTSAADADQIDALLDDTIQHLDQQIHDLNRRDERSLRSRKSSGRGNQSSQTDLSVVTIETRTTLRSRQSLSDLLLLDLKITVPLPQRHDDTPSLVKDLLTVIHAAQPTPADTQTATKTTA